MGEASAIVLSAILSLFVASSAAALDSERAIALQAGDRYAHGQLGSATKILEAGVRQHPDSAQLHFMLANAYFRGNQWVPSIHEYRRSAALQPTQPDTLLSLGYAYYRAGQYNNAVGAWKKAVALSPIDALPHVSLAIGLLREKKTDEAGRELNQAMHLDPNWRHRLEIDMRCTPQMVEDIDAFMADQRPQAVHQGLSTNVQQRGHVQLSNSTSRLGPESR